MQRASGRSEAQEQRAGRILVIRVVLNNLGARTGLADFFFADVPFDRAAKGVAAELELPRGQLLLDFSKRFHSSASSACPPRRSR